MPKTCVIADIHHGAPSCTKNGPAAAALMERFAAFVEARSPDLVVDLGDRISDVDRDTDLRLAREAAAMFAPLSAPLKHICGNHDLDHLTVAENEEILGQSLSNETVPLDGWTAVIWRPDARIHRPGGFVLPEADFLWLAGVLAAAARGESEDREGDAESAMSRGRSDGESHDDGEGAVAPGRRYGRSRDS